MNTVRRISILVVGMLVASISGMAQIETTGTVLGAVTDPAGAVVPNVNVELRDTRTNTVRRTKTNENGRYTFVGVMPSRYSINVSATGFEPAEVPSLDVEVNQSYTVNLRLQLGQEKQTVEVVSTPGAELQTLDATVGNTILCFITC